MKICGVCDRNLGLLRFKYRDGFVCKDCYKIASRTYTETIRQLDAAELKARCNRKEEQPEENDFEITGRIGNYILIDDKGKRICIVNNRLQVKGYRKPAIIPLADIRYCRISCGSSFTWEELKNAEKLESSHLASLNLELFLNSSSDSQHIRILSSSVRVKSFAFRKSLGFMKLIVEYLQLNGVECICA